MWKIIFKILIGIYLVVATYFAWQYFTHREELAICLDYPREQLVEFWEDQRANLVTNKEELSDASEAAETSGSAELKESDEGQINKEREGFWEGTKRSFFELVERMQNGWKKAEEVASESAAIVEEGTAVVEQSQELYGRTQNLLGGVKKGMIE